MAIVYFLPWLNTGASSLTMQSDTLWKEGGAVGHRAGWRLLARDRTSLDSGD